MKGKSHKIQTILLIFLVFILGIFATTFLERKSLNLGTQKTEKTEKVVVNSIYINDIPIWVEVADTNIKRSDGLSGRVILKEDNGMLFIFDSPDLYGIWMKDMNFPIDIIWIDEDFNIIDIKRDADPESFPIVFRPVNESLYVIEVNAGFVEMNNIKINDKIFF